MATKHHINRKIITQIAEIFRRVLLTPIENILLMFLSLDEDFLSHPVFVIGPPRSGTTLLYQILVQRFNFVYMTNILSKLYTTPILGIWLSKILCYLLPQHSAAYVSNYGNTDSIIGPSEAGEFWYRWFPRGAHIYVPAKTMASKSILELRRQVLGISKFFNTPVLFKNTYNSMRIAPLMEAFPQAVFLVCQRDPLDTAQSILEGRIKAVGNKKDWWSAPPKEVDEIKKHPYWEQVVEQVYFIYKQIDEDAQCHGKERFLFIPYRQLCENTHGTLEIIHDFLDKYSVNVSVKGETPDHFQYSTGKKINDEDYARLQKKVNDLWKL